MTNSVDKLLTPGAGIHLFDLRDGKIVGELVQEIMRLRDLNAEMLAVLEMVRDANLDEPHIPPAALAAIESAIAKAGST